MFGKILDADDGVLGDLKVTSSFKLMKAPGIFKVKVDIGEVYKSGAKKGLPKFRTELVLTACVIYSIGRFGVAHCRRTWNFCATLSARTRCRQFAPFANAGIIANASATAPPAKIVRTLKVSLRRQPKMNGSPLMVFALEYDAKTISTTT